MKNWQEIDPKTATHEELVEAFHELFLEHITEESKHLFFAQKVVEFTVLAGPYLKKIFRRKKIRGDGSMLKIQMALIQMEAALENCK